MLWLVQRMLFGPVGEASRSLPDLTARELGILAPVVVLIFWIGVAPAAFLAPIERSAQFWVTMLLSLTGGSAGP
jgi:NADH-quinone oxidoreductase subunit M